MIDNLPEAVQDILENDAGVSALVSTRIYINEVPQQKADLTPWIRLTLVDSIPTDVKDSDRTGVVDRNIIEIDIASSLNSQVKDVRAAVSTALYDYSGTVGAVQIQEAWPSSRSQMRDEDMRHNMDREEWNFRIIN